MKYLAKHIKQVKSCNGNAFDFFTECAKQYYNIFTANLLSSYGHLLNLKSPKPQDQKGEPLLQTSKQNWPLISLKNRKKILLPFIQTSTHAYKK